MIEADVGDDAVRPGIKAALEAEARQILVNFQEGFLINVAGIFGLVQNIQGNSQDVAVVAVHQLFKRFAVAALRAFDQGALIGRSQAAPRDSRWQAEPSHGISGAVNGPGDRHFVCSHRDVLA